MDKNFKNGCVLVIGGTGGVGSECVRTFHNHGAKVVFTYNSNKDEATKIVDELNGKVSAIQLDLSNENSVKKSLSEINQSNQGINTIVNAAGFNIPQKYISEIDAETWRRVIDSDINGFFNLASHGIKILRESQGSIVFISSAGLFKYPPGDVLSVAPKATVEQLIKGIAKEEGANGVRANSIALGVIDAGIFHRLLNEENTFFDEKWHEAVMANLAIKRFGAAEEVSNTALFLASSHAAYVTGHCIPVDVGYHL